MSWATLSLSLNGGFMRILARLRALLRRSISDKPADADAALSFADNDSPAHEADLYSSPIEAPAGVIKEVTSSHPTKRHGGFKIRLTTTIIGVSKVTFCNEKSCAQLRKRCSFWLISQKMLLTSMSS
jgi:hypothetical protein